MSRFFLCMLVGLALPAYAQDASQTAPKGQVHTQAQQFVQQAAIGDMYEIQSSQMAESKSKNPEIRSFAQHIIKDHTAASEKLTSLAQKIQGLQVPQQMDTRHLDLINRLRSASASQFDDLYRGQQVQAHRQAIQLYQTFASGGDSPEQISTARN